jgi:putative OmpL-like beta-barrel porin-2
VRPVRVGAAILGCVAPLAAAAQVPDSAAHPAATTISGYLTTSYTLTSRYPSGAVVGRLFGRQHDQFMLNVADVTFDRAAATDRWDAGLHFEPVVGQNAAVVKSSGLDLGPDADIWQAFVTLNLPVAKGRCFQFKAGKMATLMGLELFEDVQNPNLDVGTQDIFLEPFTETGIEVDGKLSSRLDAEIRVSNGWDLVTDNNRGKSVMARLGLAPDAATTIALLGYTGPEQADNTSNLRSGAQALLSHKFGGRVTSWLQLDYGQEAGAAAGGRTAKWAGAGLWIAADLAPMLGLGLRADLVDDRDGARLSGVLGYPVNGGQTVTSFTATLNIRRWPHALLRPEFRYDHSTLPAYAGQQGALSMALGWSVLW